MRFAEIYTTQHDKQWIKLFVLCSCLLFIQLSQHENVAAQIQTQQEDSSAAIILENEDHFEIVNQLGGESRAVFVKNERIYLGAGPRLQIIDSSDPQSPTLVGQSLPMPGIVTDIVVNNTLAFVTAGNALHLFDLSNAAHPALLGTYEFVDEAEFVAVTGNVAYVLDYWANLHLIDVSNPALPVELSTYNAGGFGEDMVVAEEVVYIASSDGLTIVDVSNPALPTRLTLFETTWAQSVAIRGTMAVVSDIFDGGLYLLDISNPEKPAQLGFYKGSFGRVVLEGDIAYATQSGGIKLIDIRNPAAPVEINFYAQGSYAHDIVVQAQTLYSARGKDGLQIADLSTPLVPIEIATYKNIGSASDVIVMDDHAYIAAEEAGLYLFDSQNLPLTFAPVGFYQTTDAANHIVSEGNVAYLIDGSSLRLLDVTNAEAPRELGAHVVGTVNDLSVAEGVAYVATDYYGLRIFDVRNPANPVEVAVYATPGHIRDVKLVNDIAYVVDDESGLHIVDVSAPATPVELGFQYVERGAMSLDVVNNVAYVAGEDGQLHLYDVSTPTAPIELGVYEIPGSAVQVIVQHNIAYLATRYNGIVLVDVSDPSTPVEIAIYNTPGNALRMTVIDDLIYVADAAGGLSIVRYVGDNLPGPVATLQIGHGGDVADPEQRITIPVDLLNIPAARPLGGVTVDIQYDDTFLRVVDCVASSDTRFTPVICNSSTRGHIQISAVTAAGVASDTQLAQITFKRTGQTSGVMPLTASVSSFVDTNNVAIPVRVQNGAINFVCQRGDVDCDNKIIVGDSLFILQYDIGRRNGVDTYPAPDEMLYLPACDVNVDSACNVTDALLILQCSVGVSNLFCPASGNAAATANLDAPLATANTLLQIGAVPATISNRITIPVTATVSAGRLGATTLEMTYDATQLQVVACNVDPDENFDYALCNEDFVDEAGDTGTIRFNAISIDGVGDRLKIADILFEPVAAAAENAQISLNVLTIADNRGLPMTVEVEDKQTLLFLPFIQR